MVTLMSHHQQLENSLLIFVLFAFTIQVDASNRRHCCFDYYKAVLECRGAAALALLEFLAAILESFALCILPESEAQTQAEVPDCLKTIFVAICCPLLATCKQLRQKRKQKLNHWEVQLSAQYLNIKM